VYVSLKDVAARAGVSFQTASKVLNGDHRVASAQTVERILAAARELEYVPNLLARGLARRDSITVGILVDDIADAALSLFVAGAQQALATAGHASVTVVVDSEADSARSVRRLLERRVNGVLVIAPSLEDDRTIGGVLGNGLPLVSINRLPGTGAVLLGSDHRATGALAGRHLIALGHSHIATIAGPVTRDVARKRLAGFRSVLDEAGVALPTGRIERGDWTAEGGYLAAAQILDRDPTVTALFVHSDVMAVGALRLLADRTIRVPQDTSVIGCDDLPLSRFLVPSLTTVHVPLSETGAQAARVLLTKISGEHVPKRELLPTHLVPRASTARPRGRRLKAASRARAPSATPRHIVTGAGRRPAQAMVLSARRRNTSR
jgi:LacI family transcriptional regulator